MTKKIKIIVLLIVTIIYVKYAYIDYTSLFNVLSNTSIYHYLTGKTINLKEALEQNPNLYNKNAVTIDENGDKKTISELYIPSPHYFDDKYLEFRGFDYINQLEDVTSIVYKSIYIPKNFNKVLRNMPNLKTLKYQTGYGSFFTPIDNIEHLKNLNIENFEGQSNNWNFIDVINTNKNLKTASLYNNLSERYDEPEILINNHSLLELKYCMSGMYWDGFYKELYYRLSDDYGKDQNMLKDKYAVKLKLDTPNLKNLIIASEFPDFSRFPINVEIDNNSSTIELDKLTYERCYRPKLISTNKIKVKFIDIIQSDFQDISIEESISGVDFDSVEKLYLNNKEIISGAFDIYDNIKINNESLKVVNKFINLKELKIESNDILTLDFIGVMPTLKSLYIDLNLTLDDKNNKRYGFYDISNINNLENIEDLTLKLDYPSSNTIVGLEMLKNLKNLKTLVINKEMASLLPTLEGVNVIIK